jgi:hypothetical protein
MGIYGLSGTNDQEVFGLGNDSSSNIEAVAATLFGSHHSSSSEHPRYQAWFDLATSRRPF